MSESPKDKTERRFLKGGRDAKVGQSLMAVSGRSKALAEFEIIKINPTYITCEWSAQKREISFYCSTGQGRGGHPWTAVAVGNSDIVRYRKSIDRAKKKSKIAQEKRTVFHGSLPHGNRYSPKSVVLKAQAELLSERIKMHLQSDEYHIALDILTKAVADRDIYKKDVEHAVRIRGVGCPLSLLALPQNIQNTLEKHGIKCIYELCQIPAEILEHSIFHLAKDGITTISLTLTSMGFEHLLQIENPAAIIPIDEEDDEDDDELEDESEIDAADEAAFETYITHRHTEVTNEQNIESSSPSTKSA